MKDPCTDEPARVCYFWFSDADGKHWKAVCRHNKSERRQSARIARPKLFNEIAACNNPAGGKLWRMAVLKVSTKQMCFGAYPVISLKEAREQRDESKARFSGYWPFLA